jgi:hypothetical protein
MIKNKSFSGARIAIFLTILIFSFIPSVFANGQRNVCDPERDYSLFFCQCPEDTVLQGSMEAHYKCLKALQLTIASNKSIYQPEEEISLTATLHNISDKQLIVFWDTQEAIAESDKFGIFNVSNQVDGQHLETIYIKPRSDTTREVKFKIKGYTGKATLTFQYRPPSMELGFKTTSNQQLWLQFAISNSIRIEVFQRSNDQMYDISQPSLKGYELYSWQKDGQWYFSILLGTNRLKTIEEVQRQDKALKGVAMLKDQLNTIPRGGQVFWNNWSVPNLQMPSESTVEEIRQYAAAQGLDLGAATAITKEEALEKAKDFLQSKSIDLSKRTLHSITDVPQQDSWVIIYNPLDPNTIGGGRLIVYVHKYDDKVFISPDE